jgi:hypothetical protein
MCKTRNVAMTAMAFAATMGGTMQAEPLAMKTGKTAYVIREMDNPRVVPPRFRPRFCDPRDPKLVAMRQKEKLDTIVGDATDEWNVIGKIAAWTCARVQSGPGPAMEDTTDGVELLRQIDEGRSGFACGTFSHIFVDALASFGIVARTIGITARDISLGKTWNHATSEVWSDRLGKWVYVDSELILYYELNGTPLSAMELQDCLKKGVKPTLRHFDDAEAEKWIKARNFQQWKAAYFEQFQMPNYDLDNYHVAADFVENGVRDGKQKGRPYLVYWPPDAPWRPHYYSDRYHYVTTADPRDVNWPVNCVDIRLPSNPDDTLVVSKKGIVKAELAAYAPFGEAVLVRVDEKGEWIETSSKRADGDMLMATYGWSLHNGANVLEVRVRSALGRLGHVSRVKVEQVVTRTAER